MKILVAGDFCPKYKLKDILSQKNYACVFSEVKALIDSRKYDCSIVNLECPIISENNYKPIQKVGPNLYSSIDGLYALKYAGFDTVTLANNHILDYGEDGLLNTINCCHDLGFATVGAGVNIDEAQKVLYKNICGKVLAIINCCEHEFSIAFDNRAGANPLNPVLQYYNIVDAKKKADHIIVIVHGGHEYYQLPSTRMVETYRFFIDVGADVVVNHHQHVFSGYEIYKGKPIFYGLGNFCFDNLRIKNSKWHEGYAVELNFNNNNILFEIHPYNQCLNSDSLSVSFEIDKDRFKEEIIKLNEIISSKKELSRYQNEYYLKSWKLTEILFEPYVNKILTKLYRLKLLPSLVSKKKKYVFYNYINCESHRDKILHYLSRLCK